MAKIGTRLHRFLFETERQIPEVYLGSKGDVERLEACVAAARAG